jgi:hypothetical protein
MNIYFAPLLNISAPSTCLPRVQQAVREDNPGGNLLFLKWPQAGVCFEIKLYVRIARIDLDEILRGDKHRGKR